MANHIRILVVTLAFYSPSAFLCGQETPLPAIPLLSEPPSPVPSVPIPSSQPLPDLMGGLGPGQGMGGVGGMGMGGNGYSAFWSPNRPVSNQSSDLGSVRQNLSATVPIYKEFSDTVSMIAHVRNSLFTTNAVLPNSGQPFPNQLWNIGLGVNYFHRFDNGWTTSVTATFGSASDQPFHSIHEMTVGFSGMLRMPALNERDFWLFSLSYSPVGNLNFPIPGVAYQWIPSDTFRMNIGIPFSITWRPIEDLTFNASYFPLTNVNARITYRIADPLQIFAGYEYFNESYFLVDRTNYQDRFMGFEQRVLGGLRWILSKNSTLDFQAGYAFNRYFAEGQNQGQLLNNRIDVAPGAFLGISYRLKF